MISASGLNGRLTALIAAGSSSPAAPPSDRPRDTVALNSPFQPRGGTVSGPLLDARPLPPAAMRALMANAGASPAGVSSALSLRPPGVAGALPTPPSAVLPPQNAAAPTRSAGRGVAWLLSLGVAAGVLASSLMPATVAPPPSTMAATVSSPAQTALQAAQVRSSEQPTGKSQTPATAAETPPAPATTPPVVQAPPSPVNPHGGLAALAAGVPVPRPRPANLGQSAVPTPPAQTAAAKPSAAKPTMAQAGDALDAQRQRVENLAQSLGISPTLLNGARGTTTSALERLPADARELYRTMPAKYKQVIVNKLHETSGFLMFQFSNREAFISGTAAGSNAFDLLGDKLRENLASGKIDGETADVLSRSISVFRKMTVDQRAAVVNLLEADVASHGR